MNKAVGILLLVALGGLWYWNMTTKLGIERPVSTTEYERIVQMNFDDGIGYPDNPTDVVRAYAVIKEFIYGGSNIKEDQLENALYKQRKLLVKELDMLTTDEEQLLAVKKELEIMKKRNYKIIEINVEAKNATADTEVINIRTEEITVSGVKDNYIEYTLVKSQDEKWEIYGFEQIPWNGEKPPYIIEK